MRRPRTTTLLTATGTLLVLGGIAVLASNPYATLSRYDNPEGSIPVEALRGVSVMTTRQYLAAQLVVLGLIIVAGSVGFTLGRRRR